MENIKELLKQYVKTELNTLKYKGDSVNLSNVYPGLLEDIIGDFTPYELNGYDCDYWAATDEYRIFGCMRFGNAEITLNVGEERPTKSEPELQNEKPQEPIILRKKDVPEDILSQLQTFYFTFGSGQIHEGYFQPIMAKTDPAAYNKMHEVYGTKWASMYDEEKWISSSMHKIYKELETIVVI